MIGKELEMKANLIQFQRLQHGLTLLLLVLLCSCSRKDDGPTSPVRTDIPQRDQSGTVDIPDRSPITPDELQIVSAVGSTRPDERGRWNLPVVDVATRQYLMAEINQKPILLAYTSQSAGITLDAQSTALALAMLNPVTLFCTPEEREYLARHIVAHPAFNDLVAEIRSSLESRPTTYLDSGSVVYEQAASLFQQVLESLGPEANQIGNQAPRTTFFPGSRISYEDLSGNNTRLKNPFFVYYCGGVTEYGSSAFSSPVISLPPAVLLRVNWWPPSFELNSEGRVDFTLADGRHTIHLCKGFNWDRYPNDWLNWSHPAGRATMLNTVTVAINLFVLLTGLTDLGDAHLLGPLTLTRLSYFFILRDAIMTRDVTYAFHALLGVILENRQEIINWLFPRIRNRAHIQIFTNGLLNIFRNVNAMWRFVGAGLQVPFWTDLILTAPTYVPIHLSSQGGVIGPIGTDFDIVITSPTNNQSVQTRFVDVEGYTIGLRPSSVEILTEEQRYVAHVIDYAFSQTILIRPGRNVIEVRAVANDGQIAQRTVVVQGNFSTSSLRVQLGWDTYGTDVDLWVTEPSGEKVYYGNPRSRAGGELDVDDTDGYGPENYTIVTPPSGDYLIQVHYYSDHGYGASNPQIRIFINEVQRAHFGPQRLLDEQIWNVARVTMPSGLIVPLGEVRIIAGSRPEKAIK